MSDYDSTFPPFDPQPTPKRFLRIRKMLSNRSVNAMFYAYAPIYCAFTLFLFTCLLALSKDDIGKITIAVFVAQSGFMLASTANASYRHIKALQEKANAIPPERIVVQEVERRVEILAPYPARIHEPVAMPSELGEYVYIIQDIDVTRFCKIGYTNNLRRRIGRFEVSLPFRIHCIHIIRCGNRRAAESLLHRHFYKQRISGEWFRLSDADIDYLKTITRLPIPAQTTEGEPQ